MRSTKKQLPAHTAGNNSIGARTALERTIAIEMVQKWMKVFGNPPDQVQNFLNAGTFLQKTQMQFAAYARLCDKDGGPNLISTGGGRGSAKSHGVFAQVLCDDCQRQPGLKVLSLRKIGKAGGEQFNDMRLKLLRGIPHHWQSHFGKLRFDNESLVIVGNYKDESDIDQYLGLEYDIIIIEECTQLSLDKFKNIMSCLRTSKPNWRPRCYVATNPGGIGMAWYKQIVIDPWKQGRETDTRHVQVTITDNAFCDPGYKKILESFTGWKRKAWLDGDWDIAQGAFFINFRENSHVIDSFDERKIVRWFGSFDYGWTHPSVFLLGGEDSEGNLYILDEHSKSQATIDEHAEHIKFLLTSHSISPRSLDFIAAGRDCFVKDKDGSTVATDYDRQGLTLVPAEIDRINGWAECLRRLGDPEKGRKPTMFIHRRCSQLVKQIPLAQHDEKKPQDVDKMDADPETGEGGDDSLDAWRFLVASNTTMGVIKNCIPIEIGAVSKLIGAPFEGRVCSA